MSQKKMGENLLMRWGVTTLKREEMEGNANLNGRTTEQTSKKEESSTPQLEVKKAISWKKVCECSINHILDLVINFVCHIWFTSDPGMREYIVVIVVVFFFKAKQCGTTQLNENGQGSLNWRQNQGRSSVMRLLAWTKSRIKNWSICNRNSESRKGTGRRGVITA